VTRQTPHHLQLVLHEDKRLGRVVVDMEAYFDFSTRLSDCLVRLQRRWQHFSAHRADRLRNRGRRVHDHHKRGVQG